MQENEILEKIALAEKSISEALRVIQEQKEIIENLKKEQSNASIERTTINEAKSRDELGRSVGGIGENSTNLGDDRPNNADFAIIQSGANNVIHDVEQSIDTRRSRSRETLGTNIGSNGSNNAQTIRERDTSDRSENLQRLISRGFEYANSIFKTNSIQTNNITSQSLDKKYTFRISFDDILGNQVKTFEYQGNDLEMDFIFDDLSIDFENFKDEQVKYFQDNDNSFDLNLFIQQIEALDHITIRVTDNKENKIVEEYKEILPDGIRQVWTDNTTALWELYLKIEDLKKNTKGNGDNYLQSSKYDDVKLPYEIYNELLEDEKISKFLSIKHIYASDEKIPLNAKIQDFQKNNVSISDDISSVCWAKFRRDEPTITSYQKTYTDYSIMLKEEDLYKFFKEQSSEVMKVVDDAYRFANLAISAKTLSEINAYESPKALEKVEKQTNKIKSKYTMKSLFDFADNEEKSVDINESFTNAINTETLEKNEVLDKIAEIFEKNEIDNFETDIDRKFKHNAKLDDIDVKFEINSENTQSKEIKETKIDYSKSKIIDLLEIDEFPNDKNFNPNLIKTAEDRYDLKGILSRYDLSENSLVSKLKRRVSNQKRIQFEKNLDFALEKGVFNNILYLPKSKNNFKKALIAYYESVAYTEYTIEALREYARIPNTEFRKALLNSNDDRFYAIDNWDNKLESIFLVAHGAIKEDEYSSTILYKYEPVINGLSFSEAYGYSEQQPLDSINLELLYNQATKSQIITYETPQIIENLVAQVKPIVEFDFKTDKDIEYGGKQTRFKQNIEAMKLSMQLMKYNTIPTLQQQDILSKYSGFGGLSSFLADDNNIIKIKNILGYDEDSNNATINEMISNLKLSSLNAYYTPKLVIDAIYQGLDRLGLNSDEYKKNILEPSCGSGNFLTYCNNDNYQFTAVELDPITARIAKFLHPNQNITENSYEKVEFETNFDAVIGNPPYGNELRIYDGNSKGNALSLHNYFNVKSLEMLKDKGIMAFVTTSYVLDSKDDKARKLMSEQGQFLGAFRLPNNTFNSASVTTDIIFMQKTDSRELDQGFINVEKYSNDSEVLINEYFKNNPQNILGDLVIETNQFGKEVLVCKENKELDLKKALELAINTLPSNIYEWSETKRLIQDQKLNINELKHINLMQNSQLKKGNLVISNNAIYQITGFSNWNHNTIYAKFVMDNNDKNFNRYVDFINLRDTLKSLYALEKDENSSEEILNAQRQKLNSNYDNFVKKYNSLHSKNNSVFFDVKRKDQDIEASIVLNLEKSVEKDDKKIEHIKADIFSKRIIIPQPKLQISTPKEAYLVTLSKFGYLNLNYLEEIAPNNDFKSTIKSLLDEKLIYKDHNNEYNFIEAHKYLSGNVKQKYSEVLTAIENGKDDLQENLVDLEKSFPPFIKATDINVNLGVNWIDRKYYAQFIAQELLKIDKDDEWLYDIFDRSLLLKKQDNGRWLVEINTGINSRLNACIYTFNQEYGITGLNRARKTDITGFELLEDIFNGKKIEIKDKDENDKEVINQELTMLANEKADVIKEKFNEWIFDEYNRRIDLENAYNEKINVFSQTKYDGNFLQLDDFNSNITLSPHQKDAIWRGISQKSMLLDHQVGAGKTLATIGMIMQQKKMGLINKPLIVVPNHLTLQWQKEFLNAYPNANILVADKDSMSKKYRLDFMTKIMNNDYDAIIMKHSQLNNIMPDLQSFQSILNIEINNIENTMAYLEEQKKQGRNSGKSKTDYMKKLEIEKKKVEKKLETKLKSFDIDNEIEFSRLGIDCLVVDEAHEYKNLFFTSSMGNVRGLGNREGSIKALKLYAHTQFLHENNGKVYFLTGTPVSNSIAEFYTMQRYIQPEILEDTGLTTFDDWSRNYGKIEYTYQLNASGVNFELVPSFTKFINVTELMNMYKINADIITNKDIEKFIPNFVPKLENDKPYNIVAPRSEEQANYIDEIIYRLEHFGENPQYNNVLCCTTDARKCGIDYRMIDIEADDFENSKINACINYLVKEYEATNDVKGTQLVFCDLSTPKQHSQKIDINEIIDVKSIENNDIDFFASDKENLDDDEKDDKKASAVNLDKLIAKNVKFDVYKDILKKLVKKGIPQNEIAFIHDCQNDKQKSELFEKVNNGEVRILIGSTSKMGAGTNVQRKITALYHIDAPWRPSDLEQRVGRAIRQGNEFFEKDPNFRIKEYRFATERTYDARMWQIIETKSKSMEQLKIANSREFEEIAMESTNSAEMKAEASGNPFILKKFQIDTELKKKKRFIKST